MYQRNPALAEPYFLFGPVFELIIGDIVFLTVEVRSSRNFISLIRLFSILDGDFSCCPCYRGIVNTQESERREMIICMTRLLHSLILFKSITLFYFSFQSLDYETTSSYSLTVNVTDGTTIVSQPLTISIRDANDAPVITN